MLDRPNETAVFRKGSVVSYPGHGTCKIEDIAVETVQGLEYDCYVLRKHTDGARIRVPKARAVQNGMRELAGASVLDEVLKVLRQRPKRSRATWSQRALQYGKRLASGDLTQIAEVIRDLRPKTEASYSERQLYGRALELFLPEIAGIKGIAEAEVLAWLSNEAGRTFKPAPSPTSPILLHKKRGRPRSIPAPGGGAAKKAETPPARTSVVPKRRPRALRPAAASFETGAKSTAPPPKEATVAELDRLKAEVAELRSAYRNANSRTDEMSAQLAAKSEEFGRLLERADRLQAELATERVKAAALVRQLEAAKAAACKRDERRTVEPAQSTQDRHPSVPGMVRQKDGTYWDPKWG